MSSILRAIAALFILVLGGIFAQRSADGVFRKMVDDAFPPRSVADLTTESIVEQSRALRTMRSPAVFGTVASSGMQTLGEQALAAASNDLPDELEIYQLNVGVREQLLRIEMTFGGYLSGENLKFEATIRAAAKIAIEIKETSTGNMQPLVERRTV